MEIFQTNAALGYMQLAFLVRLGKSINGYNYLCIGAQNISNNDIYQVGKIVEDLEDIYLEGTTFKVTDSELNGTYLFDYWVSHYRNNNYPAIALDTLLTAVFSESTKANMASEWSKDRSIGNRDQDRDSYYDYLMGIEAAVRLLSDSAKKM